VLILGHQIHPRLARNFGSEEPAKPAQYRFDRNQFRVFLRLNPSFLSCWLAPERGRRPDECELTGYNRKSAR
jgi:hypothetical protein